MWKIENYSPFCHRFNKFGNCRNPKTLIIFTENPKQLVKLRVKSTNPNKWNKTLTKKLKQLLRVEKERQKREHETPISSIANEIVIYLFLIKKWDSD